jgi:hypothetical protein
MWIFAVKLQRYFVLKNGIQISLSIHYFRLTDIAVFNLADIFLIMALGVNFTV